MHTTTRRNVAVLLLAALGCIGCGASKYEERLAATSTYFRYKEKLDSNLQEIFHDEATGIQIRPPRGFDRIPAPKATEGPDGELLIPELDDRQPPFFLEELPGMIAAWRTEVRAVVDSDAQTSTAYFYVLSSLGPAADGSDGSFRNQVLDQLNRELGMDLKAGSLNEVAYPANSQIGFVPQVVYFERSFVPEPLIDDLSMEFAVYFHDAVDETVCVMTIYPKNVAGLNELKDKIELSLQTLAIKAVKSDGGGGSSGDGEKPKRSGGL